MLIWVQGKDSQAWEKDRGRLRSWCEGPVYSVAWIAGQGISEIPWQRQHDTLLITPSPHYSLLSVWQRNWTSQVIRKENDEAMTTPEPHRSNRTMKTQWSNNHREKSNQPNEKKSKMLFSMRLRKTPRGLIFFSLQLHVWTFYSNGVCLLGYPNSITTVSLMISNSMMCLNLYQPYPHCCTMSTKLISFQRRLGWKSLFLWNNAE